jgi:hypothetical protein
MIALPEELMWITDLAVTLRELFAHLPADRRPDPARVVVSYDPEHRGGRALHSRDPAPGGPPEGRPQTRRSLSSTRQHCLPVAKLHGGGDNRLPPSDVEAWLDSRVTK